MTSEVIKNPKTLKCVKFDAVYVGQTGGTINKMITVENKLLANTYKLIRVVSSIIINNKVSP